MKVGGLLKFSMIDYPGKVSAVIFTQGCNICCVYCHNYELIPTDTEAVIPEEEALAFLAKRSKSLDGVVITGGEPTIHQDLPSFAAKLKAMGYLVKLDTNGTNPAVLESLIKEGLIDFVAMDIKANLNKYSLICGGPVDTKKILQSINIIKESGIGHEFRTTYDKSVLNDADIGEIKAMLPSPLKVQECKPVPGKKPSLKIER